ncbi:glycosyltransferase family 2 protein [Streptococcus sp. zg-JUN1979]|uniref:glycosyltransferase family 2 protein n=1 Tax=Streptococcus sp. zg-JUN1979 TaxID=3391450 RepID=UPI0039A74CAD
MANFGVIILNYIEYQVTIDCVRDFLKQEQAGRTEIIVVDNASPNDSFQKLATTFKDVSNVTVVKSESNQGFANGNNLGYFKLLEIMVPDFVIFSNSDILLPEQGLYQWILDCYTKYHFGVLGPSIYSVNASFYQNPIPNLSKDINVIKKSIRDIRISLAKVALKKWLHSRKGKISVNIWENTDFNEFHDDLTLHGAFQIMSKDYFEKYCEAYDTGTFLYYEENLLKLRCDKYALPMIYSPNYKVEHLQSFSTNSETVNINNKNYNRIKNSLQSLKRYLQVLKELEDD